MITKKGHQSLHYNSSINFSIRCLNWLQRSIFIFLHTMEHDTLLPGTNKYPSLTEEPDSSSRHWSAFYCNCHV